MAETSEPTGAAPLGYGGPQSPPEAGSPADRIKPYRWKPGQSGNPGGRPKGRSITGELRELLDGEHNGKGLSTIIAELVLKGALQGRLDFLKEIMDRTEGKSKEKVEVSGPGTFVIHVPPPEIIGREAYDRAVEEATRHAPKGAKVFVGDLWSRV